LIYQSNMFNLFSQPIQHIALDPSFFQVGFTVLSGNMDEGQVSNMLGRLFAR
jgi:hypothetical protein